MNPASLLKFGKPHAIYWMCSWPFFAPSLMLPTVVDHMSLNFGLSTKISAEIVQKHFLHRNALCVSLQKQALSASK